ncbi:MAG TPA: chorismate-binding protein, partial [Thermoanaerobaculia bacterium]|nr:chorismate-binding protein [Thermoanaerobaculia bacterium]
MDPRDRVASPWALLRADLGTWWRFSRPVAVLRAERPDDVPPLLGELEAAARGGLWGVGFVTYESAAAFDRALITRRQAPGVPAAWFALFEGPEEAAPPAASTESGRARFALSASVSEEEYLAGVAAIREAIARGETYQANWTYRLRGSLAAPEGGASLPPLELFARLRARQDAPYAAFLDLGAPAGARDGAGAAVCSVSPELFFSRRGRKLLCRPMKGTAPRGRSAEEDLGLAE